MPERGSDSQEEAGISERAAGELLSLTNDADISRFALAKYYLGGNILVPSSSFSSAYQTEC